MLDRICGRSHGPEGIRFMQSHLQVALVLSVLHWVQGAPPRRLEGHLLAFSWS